MEQTDTSLGPSRLSMVNGRWHIAQWQHLTSGTLSGLRPAWCSPSKA